MRPGIFASGGAEPILAGEMRKCASRRDARPPPRLARRAAPQRSCDLHAMQRGRPYSERKHAAQPRERCRAMQRARPGEEMEHAAKPRKNCPEKFCAWRNARFAHL